MLVQTAMIRRREKGGKAIVGNVSRGEAGPFQENGEQTNGKPPALAAPDGAALPIALEANGQAVRERSGARQDSLPLSRGKSRRAKGQSEQPAARS